MGSQNKAKRKRMEKSFKRQKGRCAICGKNMRMNNNPHDALGATADHIVPKSHGGGVDGNIQAVHRICNMDRGNRSMDDILGDAQFIGFLLAKVKYLQSR